MPIKSFDILLTRSTTQIVMNNTHVMYMLKVPQFSNEIYSYEYISPLVHNGSRIYISTNHIINNNSHIFELSKQCQEDDEYYYCESKILQPTTPCIYNLIQLRHANCLYEKVYSSGIITRINDATILLNNVNITLESNCSKLNQRLEGSYLNFTYLEQSVFQLYF